MVTESIEDLRSNVRSQWAGKEAGVLLDIREGLQVLVKPSVSLLGLVKQKRIPNSLLAQAQKVLEDSSQETKPEEVGQMAELAEILCREVLIYPELAEYAPDPEDGQERGIDPKPRDFPDVIDLSDLGDDGVITIINYTQKGLKPLNNFRNGQGPADSAGPDVPQVHDESVVSSGD
jgi:hypothetical protein